MPKIVSQTVRLAHVTQSCGASVGGDHGYVAPIHPSLGQRILTATDNARPVGSGVSRRSPSNAVPNPVISA